MINVLIGLVVVAWLIYRQLQARPAKETSAARLILILGAIGVVDTVQAVKGHTLGASTVALLLVGVLVGAGFGALRAMTVKVWRASDGVAWRQGTLVTGVLWIVSLAVHFGVDALVDHTTTITGLGTATILIYLAVTLGVQREIVRARAAGLRPVNA